jgi:hypothetical protein
VTKTRSTKSATLNGTRSAFERLCDRLDGLRGQTRR